MQLPSGGFVLLALVGLASIGWAASSSLGERDDDLAREEERSVRCDLQRVLRDSFAAFLDKIHEELEQNDITLQQASVQVLSYCRQCYPTYLDHLHLAEDGPTFNDMVAQNLVRSFQSPPHGRERIRPELIARLQAQLQEMLRESSASASFSTSHEGTRYTVQ